MKKMIAFMFAAFAAVVFGQQQEEAPESWYTADGWNKNFSVSRFNDGKKDYGLSAYYDQETESVTTMWGDDSKPSAAIAFAAETAMIAQWNADKTADGLKTLANTIYNKAITKIEPNDNGGYKFYTSNGGGGNDYSGSIDIPKYTIENAGDEFELKKDGKSIVGSKKWKAFSGVDEISLENYSAGSGQEAKVRIKGWHNPSQHHALSDLADSLTNEYSITRNYQLVARASTGGLNYVDLGRLNIGQLAAGGCGEADECSITTNAEGNVGKMALYGFHDDTTDIGAIPYCNLNQLEWLNPTVTGAVLVSGGTGGFPAFTAKSARNYYYGTSKPADPGDTVLGWHELPNVTTNYVEGDERTITADNTIDPESGEICKKLKLTAEPRGGTGTENLLFGAKMVNDELKWEPVSGGYVAPLIADNVTITNADNKLALTGFASATDGQFLARKSATEVEWKSVAVDATAGLESTGDLICIQNYMMTPTATFADKCGAENYAIFARKRTDSPTGSTYSVEFVSMSQTDLIDDKSVSTNAVGEMCIKGYDSARRTGAIPCKYGDSVHWTETTLERRFYGTGNSAAGVEPTIGWQPLDDFIPSDEELQMLKTNLKEGGQVKVELIKDDTPTGKVYQVSLHPSLTDTNYYCYAVDSGGNLRFEKNAVLITNIINAASEEFVKKSGDTMSGDLTVNASVTANEMGALYAAINDAEMNTCDITNLTAVMSAELPAATTIDGKAAVLVDDPPEGQPKIKSMKIENDKLVIIDADGVPHYFTQDPITP